MKQYDLTVMIHPDLEMNLQPALDKVAKAIGSVGGKITKEMNEGKRRMAYKIANQEFAIYYAYDLELPTDAPEKLERALVITDEVLRHLLVTKDERREKMLAKRKEAGIEEETEEAEEEEK